MKRAVSFAVERPIRACAKAQVCALAALLLSIAALPSAPARAADPAPAPYAAPVALVEETLAKVLAILNQADLASEVRRERIEAIAFDVFDFATMSKLVLARNWRRFDEAQREEFVAEFKHHLSRNYGSRLDRYQQTDVRLAGHQPEPRGDVTVRTRVVGGQFDGVEINYRLRESKTKPGEWRVIDVVIEGVSLVANFRSQFVEVVSRGGPEELLRQLREKNAEAPETESETKTDA